MKKIISILFITSSMFFLSSCEEELTNEFPVNFKVNMNIDVETARNDVFPFTHSELLDIDKDVTEMVEDIKNLDIEEVECIITDIPNGAAIKELKIIIEEVHLTVTLTDITNNQSLVLPISGNSLNALEDYLYKNHKSTINATGTTTLAPMKFGVKLIFHSEVEAPF